MKQALVLPAAAARVAIVAVCLGSLFVPVKMARAQDAAASASAESSAKKSPNEGKGIEWVQPYAFQLRTTEATASFAQPGLQGKPIFLTSETAPEVTSVLANELRKVGLQVVSTPDGAVPVRVTVSSRFNRVSMGYLPKLAVDVLPLTEEAIKQGRQMLPAGNTADLNLIIPLGGYSTPVGATGWTAGGLSFVVLNLMGMSGARHTVNSWFGGDATGTVCFRLSGRNSLICDRRKGPIHDTEIGLEFDVDGVPYRIKTRQSLIQMSPNPMQALSYAVQDVRDAAVGARTPTCNYMNSKVREDDCDVPSQPPATAAQAPASGASASAPVQQ